MNAAAAAAAAAIWSGRIAAEIAHDTRPAAFARLQIYPKF